MYKKTNVIIAILGVGILFTGCGGSTKMVLDTQENTTQATTIEDTADTETDIASENNNGSSDNGNYTRIAEETAEVQSSGSDEAADVADNQNNAADVSDSNADTSASGGTLYTTIIPDSDGNIVIDKDSISNTASYYNYQSGDTIVQLVGIATDSGEKRLAFNTCQSCNPSPQAYYQQQGDLLICQNCGFDFSPEAVGAVAGGCNPMPLEKLTETDEQFLIPAAYLDTFVDVYASWTGPVS